MTPVDIDKLKELLSRATPRDWVVVAYGDGDSLAIHDARGDWRVCFMATPSKDGDFEGIEANAALIVAAVNSLPALIAKAERVDVLERALERITQLRFRHAESCAAHPEYGSAGQCTCRAYEAANLARNALSPKESK